MSQYPFSNYTLMLLSKFKIFKNGWVGLAINCSLMLLLLVITQRFVLTERFYQNSFASFLSQSEITGWFSLQRQIQYYGFIIILSVWLVKYIVVSTVIYAGLYLLEGRIQLRKIFFIVVSAEYIFFVQAIFKIVHFATCKTTFTYQDWLWYSPLSILSCMKRTGIAQLWLYPLSLINAFELIYFLLLTWLIHKVIKGNFFKTVRNLAFVYIPVLTLWIVIIMFYSIIINTQK